MDTPKAFKSYDIRGRYPKDIDEQFAEQIGKSIGTMAPKQKKIVVGGDNNTSTPSIRKALISGIISTGTDVIDIGIGPTDMIAFSGMTNDTYCSIMITASHLGIKYNGFKFMYKKGNSFTNEDLAKIKETYKRKKYRIGKGICHLTHDKTAYQEYIEHIKKTFKKYFKKIDAKVIIDTGDGTCSLTTPVLLKDLGAKVIKINSDIDGNFRRHSDCSEENQVAYLKDEIKKHKADIAIAHDLDGDRLAVFDSNSNWITGDQLFAIFAQLITKKDDTIIASIDTSQLLEKTTSSRIIHTRVGDPFVLKSMIDNNAKLAGEPNGHYALKEFIPYNSATLFALVIAALAKKIPDIIDKMPGYDTITKKIKVEDRKSKMNDIITHVKSNHTIISTIDGIKYTHDNSTILIRPSGTENALRIVIEDKSDAKKKLKETIKTLKL